MAEKKKENFGRKLQKAGRNFGNGFRSLFGLEEKPSLGSHENIDRLDKNFQPQQNFNSSEVTVTKETLPAEPEIWVLQYAK